ncbi:MAG: VTT domain-containing protein [Bacteroidetes bacterium]|nr:VTT domain-containing protein [Bacteroidota bacterium]
MIELFKHIIHLDFEWLFQNYNNVVYTILFLVIFIETGLVLMPFLPGDSLLFTAGLFANQINSVTGEPYLNLGYLLVLLLIAAIVGDNVNYWVGRKIGLKMLKIKFRGKNVVKEEYLTKTHAFYEKYGPKTIIMARFVPIVRTFAPFVAGVAEMNYKKFLSFDILGGVLWIFSLTLAGYFLGEIPWIRNNIEKVALGIIFISILPIIIEIAKAKMAKKAN